MANCSYLYSSPNKPDRKTKTAFTGLSEWANQIPLSHLILTSVDTTSCPSTIWDTNDHIALCGNYNAGAKRLFEFLDRLNYEPLTQPIVETKVFLSNPDNIQEFAVLEPLEIFEFYDDEPTELTIDLVGRIRNLESEMEKTISVLNNPNSKSDDIEESMHFLGLHNWTNILYYDFSENS